MRLNFVGVITNLWCRIRNVKPLARKTDPLDRDLFAWNEVDCLTLRDLLNGGVCITGRSGSGKTSSSGKLLGKAIINHPGSGGLILAAKPEDLAMWQTIFDAAGRIDDLRVFSPHRPWRFNFLGYVLESGGQTRDVTRCITVIGETLRNGENSGREDSDFWEREQARMIHNAVEIIKLGTGTVTAPAIQRFIQTAPQSTGELSSEYWRADYCNECLAKAFDANQASGEPNDFHLAADYWLSEFPQMAEKTRSSILTGVLGLLHVFNSGVVRELVSTTTTCSPDDMLCGKWIIVNIPPSEWGDTGTLICAGWKYLTQRRLLRRATKSGDAVNVIWADEYHQFLNSYDSYYLAQCRSRLGCMVVLSQSLSSYYAALGGESGKHQVDALLPNFSTKIFHALGDTKTAEWASGLIGKDLETFCGMSIAPAESLWDEFMGHSKVTTSLSEHYEPVLQPRLFMNGLRTGGLTNRLICDAIVIRSGEPFSNGLNWLMAEFSQSG